ncbi:hypothetical protein DUNSADRAFT_17781 [Dunaliella salina]|uniref:Peptidase S54 rhomboid domain-containing protein n=1 Tax=Dunaliella salina TaxID=3046 RepID=A0ABQ7G134_DUNSA|nr:hypothetical protein DUNSADRAFT_17781 [Dunaliella salina]|eukprot:KAF5828325.1 hypothetical protein DUNSADRAFT_17781 [Dunaliella salina]
MPAVAGALASKSAFPRNGGHFYYIRSACGFSSVACAIQVVTGEQKRSRVPVTGIDVPSQFLWVRDVMASHILFPESSFPGHISGVLAGLVYVHGIKPIARLVKQVFQGSTSRARRPTATASDTGPRILDEGTTSGRDSEAEPGLATFRLCDVGFFDPEPGSTRVSD